MKIFSNNPMPNQEGEKGFILMTSYLLLCVLAVYSIGIMMQGHSFLQSAERNHKKMIAFNAAEEIGRASCRERV